jgi:hypothetical protein
MAEISEEGQAYLTKVARLFRELNGADDKTDGEPE